MINTFADSNRLEISKDEGGDATSSGKYRACWGVLTK
jgi:hypothetical protein